MSHRRVVLALLLLGAPLLVSGCSQKPDFVARYEPWREQEEQACLASGLVRANPFLQVRASLGGPSYCGAERPFEMSAALGGRVQLKPAAMLRCPMVPAVERWLSGVVEPAAQHFFRMPVVEIKVAASYSCRPMNHVSGARLSEHGHANALDVSTFILADGSRIDVKSNWSTGGPQERGFLRAVHQGACSEFTTVLGPDHDRLHYDHFHLDLARHGRDGFSRICK